MLLGNFANFCKYDLDVDRAVKISEQAWEALGPTRSRLELNLTNVQLSLDACQAKFKSSEVGIGSTSPSSFRYFG